LLKWEGTEEQHRALLQALREAIARYTAYHIADCIARDPIALDHARQLSLSTATPVHRTTLTRWVSMLDPNLDSAIPDEAVATFRARSKYRQKQLVYDFLRRSRAIHTSLRSEAPSLPTGFNAFLDDLKTPLAKLRFDRLDNLDGIYELFRRAWTTPERTDRVLVSRLVIETVSGLTRFREEQDYRDEARNNLHIQECDHGLVYNSGTNVIFIGFGQDEARTKFSVVHAWQPTIDGQKPVQELKGTMVGANGAGPHPGFPFIAYRCAQPDLLRSRVIGADKIDPEIASWIGCREQDAAR
jgi:hypothetical protein